MSAFNSNPIRFGEPVVAESTIKFDVIEPVSAAEPVEPASFISFDVNPQSLPPLETVVNVSLSIEDSAPLRPAVMSLSRRDMVSGEWGWEEVRDYVTRKIEERWGASPRDPLKEAGIFKGFVGRWGAQAKDIAVAACEVHGCIWRSAPLSITRFTKGNDPYFAAVIASNLVSPAA